MKFIYNNYEKLRSFSGSFFSAGSIFENLLYEFL